MVNLMRRLSVTIIFFYTVTLFSQVKMDEVQFKKGKTSSRINVTIFDNVIYIPISINNNSPIDFVLDTGALEISTIEKNIATKMNLMSRKGGTLRGAGKNSVKFWLLENVKLSLPNIDILNPRLGTFSLTHMEPYWGKPKYGLLGGNILKELITEIDYINSILIFHKPDSFVYQGVGQKIPIEFITNAILIKAKLQINEGDKNIEGLFLVDTGVRNTFFNSPFTRKHKLIEKSKKIVENITGFGIGGVGFGKLSRLKSIEIGNYLISEPIVELTTDTEGIAASQQFDGIIGADILSRFKVIFDYTQGEVILEPNENFHNSFEYDKSGIYIIVNDDNKDLYKVAYVIKNSPAEIAGIVPGDVLLEVNDIPVSNYNYEQMKNYFKQEGKTITLKILRNNTTVKLNIKLEKLL
jgi:hypothetical protein